MKMQKKVIVLIGLALFLANASFAQQVKTDYDRAVNFSQYKPTAGRKSRHQIRCGLTGSKPRWTQRWQRKAGPKWNLAVTSQLSRSRSTETTTL
jgi:hypothetical protein